ncbi:MAG: YqaJ viral recombinase family protein [Nitrospinaceae bacterium]
MTRGQEILGISATRASAILGLNQWKTPLLAWQEIMEKKKPGFNAERGYILPEREDKAVFRWGHAFENAIIGIAQDTRGRTIERREDLVMETLGRIPLIAYIDGLYSDGTLHEGKTANIRAFDKKWGEPGTDRIPQEYQVQIQHSMMCAGLERAVVSVLVFPRPVEEWEEEGWEIEETAPGSPDWISHLLRNSKNNKLTRPGLWADLLNQMGYFHQYPVEAKPKTQKLLRTYYAEFWERFVLTEKEPDITDYEDIRRLFTAPKGTLVVSGGVAEWMREYKEITKETGDSGFLAKRKTELKTKILEFSRNETTVVDDESQEKIIFLDATGKKVGQFDGKTFRT